jgi:hypothetical protein
MDMAQCESFHLSGDTEIRERGIRKDESEVCDILVARNGPPLLLKTCEYSRVGLLRLSILTIMGEFMRIDVPIIDEVSGQ